ncbi:hypothetical protein VFPFJ_05498 [Purpureocillium lilacinum]|uniref:Uncharacterized protein n=1 Tax=Purpureocillium lilacinum TaxID=33203 RepID=A0A179HHZ6_PURLI|nr:hypothetical protein VFPFJ_05498 [Purpureocillium lilacinum]OAQ89089.1 hypothetical protein VFPFJ_05498 [Purpureocillium lilacinum]
MQTTLRTTTRPSVPHRHGATPGPGDRARLPSHSTAHPYNSTLIDSRLLLRSTALLGSSPLGGCHRRPAVAAAARVITPARHLVPRSSVMASRERVLGRCC